MTEMIRNVRGMPDVLPEQTPYWQHIEQTAMALLQSYGYAELRLPLLESTDLFTRSIGAVTDIVEKEMYTFADRNGDSLSLRPEGTAGAVRCMIQHGLLHTPGAKIWYQGPMFRHERPQRGRQRQFSQIGVEAFGIADAGIDAELIIMTRRLWQRLGLADQLSLKINSLGNRDERHSYRKLLQDWLRQHQEQLDDDCRRRMQTNPLRVLDSKNPPCRICSSRHPHCCSIWGQTAGRIMTSSAIYWQPMILTLYMTIAWCVVWIITRTRCLSGRPRRWVHRGLSVPADVMMIWWRYMVPDRRLASVSPWAWSAWLSCCNSSHCEQAAPLLYVVVQDQALRIAAVQLLERCRDALPDAMMLLDHLGGSMRAQMKRANRSQARLAVIVADAEHQRGEVVLRPMTANEQQQTIASAELPAWLARQYSSESPG